MPFSLGFWAAAGAGGGAAGAFEQISTTILSSTQTTVTFSSIPSTYKHLEIRYTMRTALASTSTSSLYMTFNGISSSVYSWHELVAQGAAVASTNGATQPQMVIGNGVGAPRDSNPAGIFGAAITQVLDYADVNKFTTIRTLSGVHIPSSRTGIGLTSGLYQQTNAVSSISITDSNGAGFVAGSRFSLYGIKG